ncbi:hypothetical protein [Falsiroseomonas sp.]|uniref:hypothetical protein n=1 Tax=Falsiroseomonas sp. TaxID=2870721 RepID=UPI0035676639
MMLRTGPHPRDGRGKLVFLADAGRAGREQAVAVATASIPPRAAGLPDSEIEAALPLLRRLRAAPGTARDADPPSAATEP